MRGGLLHILAKQAHKLVDLDMPRCVCNVSQPPREGFSVKFRQGFADDLKKIKLDLEKKLVWEECDGVYYKVSFNIQSVLSIYYKDIWQVVTKWWESDLSISKAELIGNNLTLYSLSRDVATQTLDSDVGATLKRSASLD